MTFDRTQFQGMDGIPKVRFTLKENDSFFIEASPSGVRISGEVEIEAEDHYRILAHTQVGAWREHDRLKKAIATKLKTNLAGH